VCLGPQAQSPTAATGPPSAHLGPFTGVAENPPRLTSRERFRGISAVPDPGRRESTSARRKEPLEVRAKRASQKAKSGNVFGHARKLAKMFRASLYARVSTNDQQTLAMRNRAMREYTARRGWSSCESVNLALVRRSEKRVRNCWRRRGAVRLMWCWSGVGQLVLLVPRPISFAARMEGIHASLRFCLCFLIVQTRSRWF